jgi:hypothetical protein
MEPCISFRLSPGEILLHFPGSRPTARFDGSLVHSPITIL